LTGHDDADRQFVDALAVVVSYTSAAKQNGFKFNLLYDGPYERAISLSAVAETYSARRDRLKAVRPRRF
jgi:hypothetical protein